MLIKTKIISRIDLLYRDLYQVKMASCSEEIDDIVFNLHYGPDRLGDFGGPSVAKIMNSLKEFQE